MDHSGSPIRPKSEESFYKVSFECNDSDELQNLLNDLYGYSRDTETKILHRKRMNLFYILMQDLLGSGQFCRSDSALDIGSSAGAYSKIIFDLGFRYVCGIDVVPESVDNARRSFAIREGGRSLEFFAADATGLSTSRKYDMILCTEVIEHVENPVALIRRIQSLLSQGGIAVVSIPNSMSLPYFLARIFWKCSGAEVSEATKRHLQFPSYRTMELLSSNGLKVIRTSGTNLMLNGFILKVLHKSSIFPALNRIDSFLSSIWPFKFFSQFFFVVLKAEVR